MSEVSEVSEFFEYLSWRMNDENDLSDITWSFCESSEKFRNFFLTFFFGEDEYNWNRIVDFRREYPRKGSRPDFYFKNEEIEYIIEVKINDENQHFEQYNKPETFEKSRKGYITNYKINDRDGYSMRTWEDFRNRLKESKLGINEELLKGYISYLDEVCLIEEVKKMKLSGIESLYHFYNTIDKIIKCDNDNYFSTKYTRTNKADVMRQGRCFYLNLKKVKVEEVWGWIGLYFAQQPIVVCVEFENKEGWGLPVFEILDSCKDHSEGKYASEPYEEWGAYYFNLLENRLEEFEKLDSVKKQIEIIGSFFQEVVQYVETKASR